MQFLDRWHDIHTAASADTGNVWGNAATTDIATVAVDAQYRQNKTFDCYKTKHGCNGIANDR